MYTQENLLQPSVKKKKAHMEKQRKIFYHFIQWLIREESNSIWKPPKGLTRRQN